MKEKRKRIICRIGLLFLIIFCLTAGAGTRANADFGDHNSYSSSGGGGSSWDSDEGGSFALTVIVVIGFIIFMIISAIVDAIRKGMKSNQNMQNMQQIPQYQQPQPMQEPSGMQRTTLPDRTMEISNLIKRNDPMFTAPDIISFAKQVFVDVQDAWSKRDLSPVRAVMHQNLYQQTERQVQKKIADGIVNHLERISVNTAYLTSYQRDMQYEYLGIYMAASMIDYQVQESTGRILYGDRTTRWNLYYKMIFMRSTGSRTLQAGERNKGMMCPNCGAPLTGTSFGKCDYCGSIITTGAYDWVLSDFGTVKNDTVDEGIRIQ